MLLMLILSFSWTLIQNTDQGKEKNYIALVFVVSETQSVCQNMLVFEINLLAKAWLRIYVWKKGEGEGEGEGVRAHQIAWNTMWEENSREDEKYVSGFAFVVERS